MPGIIMYAISLSIDSLGIGISYGVRKIVVPHKAKVVISLISAFITAVGIYFGQRIALLLSVEMANFIGIGLLFLMGCWIIFQGVKNNDKEADSGLASDTCEVNLLQLIKEPETGDVDKSCVIEIREAVYIGLAVSIDAFGAGIAMGTLGFHSIIIPLSIAIGQFLMLSLGIMTGKRMSKGPSNNSNIWVLMSGGIMIGLAVIKVAFG